LIECVDNANICFNFNFQEVNSEEVCQLVKRFKPSDSVDIFDMSSNLIKEILCFIIEPLTFIINRCLHDGKFPSVLKLSRVVPIFKKGDRSCPSSYRPISITPIFSKILESVMYAQISSYLEQYDVISNEQYGFRRGRSTIDAIDSLVEKVLGVFETKGFAEATFCDLSKAFDCVDHEVLLNKLMYYGIRGQSHDLFKSFLDGRQQIVCIGSDKSDIINLKYGVPQGSVLGPLLFTLMINDLPHFVNSQSILYADDTTFFNNSSELDELNTLTEDTLSQASVWFRANGLCLNDSKTQKIIFSLRNVPINESPDSIKFLGLYIDNKLSWGSHIKYLSVRLSRVIYLIRKLKTCVPDNYVRSAYFAYFQSIVSYGILLWGNSSHVQDVLILQKKVVRVITDSNRLEHCKPLFVKLGCLTIVNLYIYHVLIYIKTNLSVFSLNEDIHSYNTRSCKKINVPYCRLSRSLNSYSVLGLKMYNKLPLELTALPLNLFKNKVYNILISKPFYSLNEFFVSSLT
jgi:hypothetical protein